MSVATITFMGYPFKTTAQFYSAVVGAQKDSLFSSEAYAVHLPSAATGAPNSTISSVVDLSQTRSSK